MLPNKIFIGPDGTKVVAPDSLELITPYVLEEQQDWFEDEIKFVRKILHPGKNVIDIGAHYGTYTLSMAHVLGPQGHVWAFEPASSTAELLSAGVLVNHFSNVTIVQCALADNPGKGRFSLNNDSESNALSSSIPDAGAYEIVEVSTLDQCQEKYGWKDISFLKIDAEGAEHKIIRGGAHFLQSESPLIQYEIRTLTDADPELTKAFASLGYQSYRLVPGLQILVPYEAGEFQDAYLLNLFCCKKDRARQLESNGFLVTPSSPIKELLNGFFYRLARKKAYHWRKVISNKPYAADLRSPWLRKPHNANSKRILRAITLYLMSQDPKQSPYNRYRALDESYRLILENFRTEFSPVRLASLSRIAKAIGARARAVDALRDLINRLLEGADIDLSEPFLAPGERFETVNPGESYADWLLAAALEEFERLGTFSSFYSGTEALHRLEMIQELGFGDEEMRRRLHLVKKRFGFAAD